MEKLLLSPEEAAEVLGVGRSRVYDLIRNCQLHSVREVASGSGGRSSRLRRTLDRARRSGINQRAIGEGSIYRRSDGRWTAACYLLRPAEHACAGLCTARPARRSLTSWRF